MVAFSVEELSYKKTENIEIDFIRSGTIQIQPTNDPNANSIDIPFLWWTARRSSNPGSYKWWEDYELQDGGSLEESGLSDLRFVKFNLIDIPDGLNEPPPLYYLVLPQLDNDPFLDLNGIEVDLASFNPSAFDDTFNTLLKDSYEGIGVENQFLEIPDLCPVRQQCIAEVDPQPPVPPEKVPEPGTNFGILALAIIFFVAIVKRNFSSAKKTKLS
ncbi:MAG: hypothetical protein SAJ37_07205 [Oscillatoria sp. PMC 1068.18]|nr:hypothetical protein [Oscillatoria sp. PMC 1076.18]MEC4988520.1 hypothetical protein [Oscillatoria sp. PMC 1068.18]